MKTFIGSLIVIMLLLSFPMTAHSQRASKPELIRDTGIAEGKDPLEEAAPKERDPESAKESITIGNFYLKRRNYVAAIERYLEALEYENDSVPAHEALAQAYERNGERSKAIQILQTFIEQHPDSPKTPSFKERIRQLEQQR